MPPVNKEKHGTAKRSRVQVSALCPGCDEWHVIGELETAKSILKKNVDTIECGICGEKILTPSIFVKRVDVENTESEEA